MSDPKIDVSKVENQGNGYVRVEGYVDGQKTAGRVPKESLDRAEKAGQEATREYLHERLDTAAQYDRERRDARR